MKKKVNIICNSDSQWLRFSDNSNIGGIILKTGNNKIDIELWNKIKDSAWCKHLLAIKIVKIKTKEEELEEEIDKIANVDDLEKLLDKTEKKSVKVKISRKIEKVVDGE